MIINQILIHIHISNIPLLLSLIVPYDFLILLFQFSLHQWSVASVLSAPARGGHDGLVDRYNMCGQMQKSKIVGQMGEMLILQKH